MRSPSSTQRSVGEEFCFPSGKEAFIEQFSTRFPKERDSIKKYVEIIESIASASSLNSLTSSNRDVAIDSDYFTRSMDSVLEELFEDELLKNVLAGDIPLYAGERRKTPFSQHAFIMDHYNSSIRKCDLLSDNSTLDKRIKQLTYLNQYWFMQTLIDRNDRMSIGSGLCKIKYIC